MAGLTHQQQVQIQRMLSDWRTAGKQDAAAGNPPREVKWSDELGWSCRDAYREGYAKGEAV